MEAYSHERKRMVDKQMVRRGIRDERVLEAMRTIPRHEFVPPEQVHQAYVDAPLPIGNSQTISQPYIVALMTELLSLKGDETVLEIGTGSGYQAAILAHLAKKVYSIERIPELAERAQSLLHSLQLENIEVVVGDGSCGLPEHAPYQAIIVTASAPEVPKPLEDQLSDGGRLVVPVGSRVGQVLELWRREGQKLVCEKLAPVAFVPLIGEHAWSHEGKSRR
ncbi:MAG: protein-L-isoaspartate(D-aspartate) O-methyltransferase [Anaerolineales bacterium]|nr:protein-L-isoaspartate(D-aspartate) O-methyltransferase [Anaerolineales bacterium]